MIKVEFTTSYSSGKIYHFKITGHSNMAPKGYDIVCSAVSTLAYTALRGLEEVLNHNHKANITDDVFDVTIYNADKYTENLLRTMVLGMKNLEKGYPGAVQIKEKIT